jgi:NitT/TauT family transport system substrate-binding protein
MRLVSVRARIPARVTGSVAPRRARRGSARAAGVMLSAALLLAGCHFPGTGSAGSAGSQGTLRVGVVQSVANAPLFVGTRDGSFAQHGVHVQILSYPTASAEFSALTSGRVDVVAGDYADFLDQQQRLQQKYTGQPGALQAKSLRLIADGYDAAPNLMEVLTLPGSNISTPQELQGKTIATPPRSLIQQQAGISAPGSTTSGISTPYSMEMLATESVLASNGVSSSSVKWQPMPMTEMIKALGTRRVAAILVTEPYIIQAESQLGATEVLDSCSGVTASLPLAGYFALGSFTSHSAATLRDFRAGLLAAQSASAMRGPVTAALPKSAGTSAQEAAMVTVGVYPTFLNVGQVQRVAQLMYESDVTSTLLNVNSMVFK